jgi:hypothetical protein
MAEKPKRTYQAENQIQSDACQLGELSLSEEFIEISNRIWGKVKKYIEANQQWYIYQNNYIRGSLWLGIHIPCTWGDR